MQRSLIILLATASLSAAAQAPADATPSQTAPIVRSNPAALSQSNNIYGQVYSAHPSPQISNAQPVAGILIRTELGTPIQTISAGAQGTEIRLDHGRANVNVHHPAAKSQILIDLPGGQTALLKDGLYTFNADTNTVRVLKGEAEVYPGAANTNVKPIKIKEDHQLTFTGNPRSTEADRVELTADLLPPTDGNRGYGAGYSPRGYGYSYGPYGDGPYGYPYPAYAYGYPGYGYYGYPYGIGLGFGYYGGYRGYYGGFRGFRR